MEEEDQTSVVAQLSFDAGLAEPVDGLSKAFVKADQGFPAEEIAGLGDVGPAALGVVLGEGLEDDLRLGSDRVADVFGEFQDGHFAGIAEVDRIGFIGMGEADEAVDKV